MIDRFLKYLATEKRYSEKTLISYQTDLQQFYQFCGVSYDQIIMDYRKIRSWIMQLMNQGYSARSISRKISALKSFYKYLLRQGVITYSPLEKIVMPKLNKHLPDFIPESQLEQLSEDLPTDFIPLRDRLIIDILYWTGMRRSELVNLKIIDVDTNNLYIKVLGKGRKERIIPITKQLAEEIEFYKKKKQEFFKQKDYDKEYLIVTDKGQKAYPEFIYRKVRQILSSVTTKKTYPHILRHSFATHLLNNGSDINAIKELLGHRSLAATEVYTHTSFENLKKIYKQAHPRA